MSTGFELANHVQRNLIAQFDAKYTGDVSN